MDNEEIVKKIFELGARVDKLEEALAKFNEVVEVDEQAVPDPSPSPEELLT